MALMALAFPELKQVDYNFIQTFRKKNDEFYFNIVKPHFIVVFPVAEFSVDDFKEEVVTRLGNTNKFDFSIRCATVNKDPFDKTYHVFLVPDKGFSNIVKIHDRLYAGKFASNLNLDVDFIPHIGIGTTDDKLKCKEMVDALNKDYIVIRGKVNSIDIVSFEDNAINTIERLKLK
jgi:hypothetical protein